MLWISLSMKDWNNHEAYLVFYLFFKSLLVQMKKDTGMKLCRHLWGFSDEDIWCLECHMALTFSENKPLRFTCFGICHCHLMRNAVSRLQEKPSHKEEQVRLLEPEQTGQFSALCQALHNKDKGYKGSKNFNSHSTVNFMFYQRRRTHFKVMKFIRWKTKKHLNVIYECTK